MSASGVTLDRVTKSYGDHLAVDDVSLEVGGGEFFSLLGPSGCGKTTSLRMIAGFLASRRGPHPAGRGGRDRDAPAQARRQHGLPELRALPAPDRRGQRGVRAAVQAPHDGGEADPGRASCSSSSS